MKVRAHAWVLAAAYLIYGAAFAFWLVPRFGYLFSELHQALPFPTQLLLSFGSWAILAIAISLSVAIILKELKFRSRVTDSIFELILPLVVFLCLTTALILPVFWARFDLTKSPEAVLVPALFSW
jgi:type II secretory pathway component PulF